MSFNPDIHQRRSIRIRGHDYTQPGRYFITIATSDRNCLFGDVVDGEMHLNRVGKIAHREWKRLQRRFPHIQLDVFTIMPDHIHGIIVISRRDTAGRTAEMALPDGAVSLREQFGKPVHGSIPTIVRSYKSSTTRWINIVTGITGGTIWQRNYYEHIIRNDASLARIRQYIINNPIKWRTGTAGHAGRQIISVHTRRASKVKR